MRIVEFLIFLFLRELQLSMRVMNVELSGLTSFSLQFLFILKGPYNEGVYVMRHEHVVCRSLFISLCVVKMLQNMINE